MHITRDQYEAIFLGNLPLLDVRAPVEFNKGAFPGACNLPLINDEERHLVGIRFKQKGQQAAIALGQQLVSGSVKADRIAAWEAFIRKHPEGYMYCFRGGLRSQTVQQWLKDEAGLHYPLVPGGYKAMRTFLIETRMAAVADSRFIVLGGLTGCGKTDLLGQLDNAVDLEGHAHHRGSSFGKHPTPQPTQINFENTLAIDFLKKRDLGYETFILEDEGRMIGHCALPLELRQTMSQSPMVWLHDSLANRAARILQDYVVDLCAEFIAVDGHEQGSARFAAQLRQSLKNIARRLGMERYQRLAAIMDQALDQQKRNGCVQAHVGWIEALLSEYYDPMYEHQRKSSRERTIFSGDQRAVLEYLGTCAGPQSGFGASHHALS